MMNKKLPTGLYGITPEWDDNKKLTKAIIEAARGGMKALQLRRKKTTYLKVKEQAIELCKVCKDIGIKFIINDFWQLAIECNADGFHLGLDDFKIKDFKDLRKQINTDFIIGTSCYNDIERAKELVESGVDYVAFGSVFQSTTKPLACHMPLNKLSQVRKNINVDLPYSIVAIGGVNINNASLVIESNIDNIAVINGLFSSNDIFNTAKKLSSIFI